MPEPALIIIELTRTATLNRLLGRPQRWRWVARNADNHRVLAVSSEAYTNLGDLLTAIEELFGDTTNAYLRRPETGDQPLRLAHGTAE